MRTGAFRARISAAHRRLRCQRGSTLVEALVAATLLIGGLLALFMMTDVASSSTSKTRAREGATNVVRELLETARDTTYSQVGQANWFEIELQSVAGGSGTVSSPNSYTQQTTVTRRGINYTVAVSHCSVDDSKDGYGAHDAAIRWCSDSSSTSTSDGKPEDLKRVTATVNYSLGGTAQPALTQTASFGPGGLSVGPQLTSLSLTVPEGLSQTAPVITTNPEGDLVTFRSTAAGAADMKFTVDGVEQTSSAPQLIVNNGDGSWTFIWNIAGLKDATYTIGALAVDALGTRGHPVTMPVKLARGAPVAPANVRGGYNYVNPPKTGSLAVELSWDANAEGSVTGYEVWKGVTKVCGPALDTYCMDTSPASSGSTTYTVKTLYVDSAGASQSVSTSHDATAPGSGGSVPTKYGFVNSQGNPQGSCVNFATKRDLNPDFPTSGGTSSTFVGGGGTAIVGCMAPLPAGVSMAAGTGTIEVWFTNTKKQDCMDTWYLSLNATTTIEGVLASPADSQIQIQNNTTTPTKFTRTFTTTARTFAAGDVLSFIVYGSTSSGSCSQLTFYYGSGTHQSTITLPLTGGSGGSLSTPGQPTGLSATANGDGTTKLTWTAPSGSPAADFYRIYRDGTTYADRVDTADATSTSVATASAAGDAGLAVANATGFSAGQSVAVDSGSNQETLTISGISGNVLAFTSQMSNAHPVGAPVSVRSVSWTDTDTGGSSHSYRVTAVSSALAESDFASPGAVTG
jgi:type II secretory pathway pseudopilin PulG